MTMNRPRLIAMLLCGLIVLMLFYLLVMATAPRLPRWAPNTSKISSLVAARRVLAPSAADNLLSFN